MSKAKGKHFKEPTKKVSLIFEEQIILKSLLNFIKEELHYRPETDDYRCRFIYEMDKGAFEVFKQLSKKV